jgi:5-(carboxyamino)imidazole ribonucleotide synthase
VKHIGILGGGQLGSLLLESIYRLGGTAAIYDVDVDAPGCRRTPFVFNGEWNDVAQLEPFFKSCDAVTYEFENVESDGIAKFENDCTIYPSTQVLKTTQDRVSEKTFISQAGLPHVDFVVVEERDKLEEAALAFGFPFIIKTARGGYDGKGQMLVRNQSDWKEFLKQPGATASDQPFRVVLERLLDIAMEVSCIVARSPRGEEVCFPVFENEHKDHILDLTVVPARISSALETAIKDIALSAARQLDVFGLLTTEFFLSNSPGDNAHGVQVGSWNIYINEFAPRPHNSGHVTMKACTISQFDALARILLGVPLATPQIVAPGYFCMGNLLGDVWLAQNRAAADLDLSRTAQFPEVIDVVIYGKKEARAKRKMGHFITYANSAQAATAKARAFREALQNNNVATGNV